MPSIYTFFMSKGKKVQWAPQESFFCEYCHLSWIEVKWARCDGSLLSLLRFSPFSFLSSKSNHTCSRCLCLCCNLLCICKCLCYVVWSYWIQGPRCLFYMCWISKCVCGVLLLNLTSKLWIKSFLLLLDVFHTMHWGVYVITCKSSMFVNGELMMVKERSTLL